MSVFENVIAFLFQHDATEMLVSGFLILVLYLFASEFFNPKYLPLIQGHGVSPSLGSQGEVEILWPFILPFLLALNSPPLSRETPSVGLVFD
jgi:hypothetical protein